jgi:hypothetical protein
MTTSLFNDTEDFLAFPESNEIFYSNFEKDVLLPIASIKHNGDVVLIAAPIEPDEGLIGEEVECHYNETCRENWISYTFIDGKLKLDCSESYFRKGSSRYISQSWYSEVSSYYNMAKDFYRKNGFLNYEITKDLEPNINHRKSLFNTGCIAKERSNWHSFTDVKYKTRYNPNEKTEEVVILDELGREYDYLGYFESFFYMLPQTYSLHVFYQPIKKQVLLTFEYS